MFTRLFISLAGVLLIAQAHSANYQEGLHYERVNITSPLLSKGVTEFFAFSCPACFHYEQYMGELEEHISKKGDFNRIHVPFGGKNPKEAQLAFVLMTLLKNDALGKEIFLKIHQNSGPFKNQQDVINFFKSKGYEEKNLHNLRNSFSAKTILNRMNSEAKQAKVASIPTLIVKGKYQVNLSEINSSQALVELVDYLLALES